MEQMISPIVSAIKFVLNQFKEIIKIGVALAIVATLLFALIYPFTLIDNYFSSNPTYNKITASFGSFSSTLFNKIGCTFFPGVCIPLEELVTKLNQQNLTIDRLNMKKNPRCEKPDIQDANGST